MFGDLTTVSLGYSVGNDDIKNNTDASFSANAKKQYYRVGVSQILTKNSLLAVNLETITDEGFLSVIPVSFMSIFRFHTYSRHVS